MDVEVKCKAQKKQDPPGLIIYTEDTLTFDMMDDETLVALFRAIYRYWRDGIEPTELPEQLRLLFPMMKNKIDFGKERYAETCERNRIKAQIRWEKNRRAEALLRAACEVVKNHPDGDE